MSRREFLSLLAMSGAGATLLTTLAACSPARSSYDEQVKRTWEQPFKKETNINSQLLEVVRYATLAPSGHNTQPWKFSIQNSTIRLSPDYSRRLPVVDPDDRELFISLGCALENLVIAARQAGYESQVDVFPTGESETLLVKLNKATNSGDSLLFDAIPQRQCTRSEYNKQAVPNADLQQLDSLPKESGVAVRLFTDAKQIEPLIEYVKEGDRRQYGNKAYVDELVTWLRFSDDEAVNSRDGLFTRCTGNPTVPRWLGQLFVSLSGADSQAKTDEKNIRSSSGMALFVSERDDKAAWVNTGRVYERFALTATALDIKSAFMNQPAQVPEVRSQLQSYLSLGRSHPQVLVRFGYANAMPRSLRRPVEQVLV
jgi:hypothetical protein